MISLILFALAVVAYTVSQASMHNKIEHDFWGGDSWIYKYKRDKKGLFLPAPNNFYYRMFKIKYREAFPLSATALVGLTDGYHLSQTFFKVLLCTSIVLYTPLFGWWDVGIYFIEFGVVFSITYKLLS